MPSVEEIWEWVYEPVQELKRDFTTAPDTPWETRRESFLSQLGLSAADQDPVIQELLRQLDEMPDADRNDIIGGDRLDALAYELAQRHGVAETPAGPGDQVPGGGGEQDRQTAIAEPAYDTDKWQEFLEKNGPQWDGTAATWDQFKEWFLYYAREGGFEAPATSLLDFLTTQDVADRIATLQTYRVVIGPAHAAAAQPPAQEPEPPVTAGDMDELMAELIAENPELRDIPEARRQELIAEVLREAQTGAD